MHILLPTNMPMQQKIRHPCRDKKILNMHVSSYVDIFLAHFLKHILTIEQLQEKTTLLDEEYGRVVYSMFENNDQSIFFFIIFLILLYG